MSRSLIEQNIIGGVMLGGLNIFNDVAYLQPEMFTGIHADIWRAIRKHAANGVAIDVITVSEEVPHIELVYLGELSSNTPSSSNVRSYASLLVEYSAKERIVASMEDALMHSETLGSRELAAKVAGDLGAIVDEIQTDASFESITDICDTVINRIEAKNSGNYAPGAQTGFKDLDDKLGDMEPGDLIVLGARPMMGKTSFALNVVENVCKSDRRVIFLSLEMAREQLVTRMIASAGKFNSKSMRTQMQDEDWPRFNRGVIAVNELKNHLFIADQSKGKFTVSRLSGFVKAVQKKYGPTGLIVVDYLQLFSGESKSENRTIEVGGISRDLKIMAQMYECPVLVLSQLNRKCEDRANKRPANSDLRDSGAIEQDADSIIFIYRDEVYNSETPSKGIAEIIIGKNRNGEIGTCNLAFIGNQTRFADLNV